MEIDESAAEPTEYKASSRLALVDKWRQLFTEGRLAGSHFRDHWRLLVPKAFVPLNNGDRGFEWVVKKDIIRDELLATLEEFICDGDTKDLFKQLSTQSTGSLFSRSVCGKVFKSGEPFYNCSDCAIDVTCVLCVSCFKQSPHRFHRYKMGTSSSGGCCDCGDMEAWKSDPHCDSHLTGKALENEDSHLPQILLRRAGTVFSAVLQYCSDVLTLDAPDLRLCQDEAPDLDMELYCIILNDYEFYPFKEVVSIIMKATNCSLRSATYHVTKIDKEGRTVIHCSSFLRCSELKCNIEKFSSRRGDRPLQAVIVHSHMVAHQMFALKLLDWLLELNHSSKNFRKIFTSIILNMDPLKASSFDTSKLESRDICFPCVERIILQDLYLWKIARFCWQRLIIGGVFMEYENKKAFAKVFINLYPVLLNNFMRKKDDYSLSFASLSIQMFTVPTLALNLIANEDVLYKLLNTFVAKCSRKRNDEGKLEFRSTSLPSFRRTMVILHDLRYLLHSPPDIWTSELRRGFIKGVTMFLNLLSYMQGMNSVKREIGNHTEYEPEWETAFSLQTKLSPIITSILKWCEKDQIVFSKVYVLTLRKLFENCSKNDNSAEECIKVANHKAVCYMYDVSSEPVSIHLPLSRFLAGLFLYFGNFGFTFYSNEFISLKKPTLQEIIEPVLRAQVMMAQVHANMWRKNGYSLSNQIYYYHEVKCRREMQDKDIVLLQFVASLMNPDEFLIQVLNKFKLIDWVDYAFETDFCTNCPTEDVTTTPKIAEEFLSLLITIVSERFVPGVGKVAENDCLKNEIIHKLFIKPLSHSELNETLPWDVNRQESDVETVINQVATFKKPTHTTGKGFYIVKEEYIDKYNVFFYHYSKEDMSRSEEEQRKLRKSTFGFECCPPPVLPHFTQTFQASLGLLQCDVMLHIIKIVLERTLNIKSKSCTEWQLYAVLHLIGYALQAQEENSTVKDFTKKAEEWGIRALLEDIFKRQRIEAHKDLIRWILWRFNAMATPTISSIAKMDISSIGDQIVNGGQDQEKFIRAKLAAEKRATILEHMAVLQKNFLKENASLFKTDSGELSDNSQLAASCDCDLGIPEPLESSFTVALGCKQSSVIYTGRVLTCILCQEDQVVNREGPALIIAAFFQRSAVLVRQRNKVDSRDPKVLGSNIGPATHLSTCGHVMHVACWREYVYTAVSNQIRRPFRFLKLQSAFDSEKNEYLCPLCQRLSNTVLPVMPHLSAFCQQPVDRQEDIAFSDWYQVALVIKNQNGKMHERTNPDKPTGLQSDIFPQNEIEPKLISCAENELFTSRETLQCKLNHECNDLMSKDCMEVINTFTEACCNHEFEGKEVVTLDRYFSIWKICAYTVHSLERLHRYMNKSLLGNFTSREKECLENLIRLSGVAAIVNGEERVTREVCLQMLNRLFGNDTGVSILDLDGLGTLVPLTVCMPNIYCNEVTPVPLGRSIENHCFRVALLIHFAQTIICTDLSKSVFLLNSDVTSKDTECLVEIVRIFKDCKGINTIDIWAILKRSSISFLRSCVIFYHFLTGVPAPKVLNEIGGDSYENMMSFLGMPTSCQELLAIPSVLSILRNWASHPCCAELRHQLTCSDMVPLNGLVELPEDYSEIINSATSFRCLNNAMDDIPNPNMCLICGQMFCAEMFCCQQKQELNSSLVGPCTSHAHSCGSGVGVFLRIRDCELLLTADVDKGCFMAAPYLDEYGEVDQGLKRGNRMLLCRERYRDLQVLWLSHGVLEHIARSVDHNTCIVPTQWHHL